MCQSLFSIKLQVWGLECYLKGCPWSFKQGEFLRIKQRKIAYNGLNANSKCLETDYTITNRK